MRVCMSALKRTRTITCRVTEEEYERLERDAAGTSISDHMRACFFGDSAPVRRTRGKFPVKDHKLIAQLLAKLGDSRIANNLNQLARLANTGSLPVTPETEETLRLVCRYVADVRRLLLQALGLSVGPP